MQWILKSQQSCVMCVHGRCCTINGNYMMMMGLCPKAGSLALTSPGDEMSEVVSHCLPHRQLWVINLSKVATRWLKVDSNPRPSGCKAQNVPLHHCIPLL